MDVAVIGRSRSLLSTVEKLVTSGHRVRLIVTCEAEDYYGVGVGEYAAQAERIGARFLVESRLNRPEMIAVLRDTPCRVGVSVNWPTVIGEQARACFEFGILNAHAGDLPRYRGNAPPNWAILAHEDFVGLCIHQMGHGLDDGPVVLRERLDLTPHSYIGEVYEWIERRVPPMFVAAIEGLAAGSLVPVPQPEDAALGLRCYPRRPEDGEIDWRVGLDSIYRLIRASSRPFAGAFSHLEGEVKVTIWRATPVADPAPFLAVPGQICYRDEGRPVVACADGLLRLDEVEVEGAQDEAASLEQIGKSLRARLTSPCRLPVVGKNSRRR